MRVLDLFSGIGGMSLGLERAGMTTVAFCEIEEFPRQVLAHHWPEVPIHGDVTTARFDGPVDLVAAGFPCQDISLAGKGAGLAGQRSGLFWHALRAVRMVGRPKLLLENVAALLNRGMDSVLGALASIGYDAEWHCIPASALGAPHRRDRLWIVAHPECDGLQGQCLFGSGEQAFSAELARGAFAGGDSQAGTGRGWWTNEPDVGRVADGVPARAHRLKALGNSVVPQIPEVIGRAIMEAAA